MLSELDAAQVFAQNRGSIEDLHAAIKEAACPNPANLVLAGRWVAARARA